MISAKYVNESNEDYVIVSYHRDPVEQSIHESSTMSLIGSVVNSVIHPTSHDARRMLLVRRELYHRSNPIIRKLFCKE